MYHAINFRDKFSKFAEHWSPKIIAQTLAPPPRAGVNDYHFKLAKVQGEFVWHDHPETDEVFLVITGKLEIHLYDGKVILNEGELYVVPKGVAHKPFAEEECDILLVEPAGTINTGGVVDEKTAPNPSWI